MTNKINLAMATELYNVLDNIIVYETDNSCGDPECCGGPWVTREQYKAAVELLQEFGITYENN